MLLPRNLFHAYLAACFIDCAASAAPSPLTTPCPGIPECSGHGQCGISGVCDCEKGWTGEACGEGAVVS